MIYPDCPVCGEILEEKESGIDNWEIQDDPEDNFIVRELTCENEDCPLHDKRQDWFFDFNRIDIDGDEINYEELREEFASCEGGEE